jgi:hypothetical protein
MLPPGWLRNERAPVKPGPNIKDRCIPVSLIRRLWLDPTLTAAQGARLAGLTRVNFWRRAKALGLPSRGTGGRPFSIPDEALFRRMWAAGLSAANIAAHFGVHRDTPLKFAKMLGLPTRGKCRKPLTLAQFHEAEMARQMAGTAAQERAALRNAEMVDDPRAFARACRRAA